MKIRTLFFSMLLLAASFSVNAQIFEGTCASYIQTHDAYSLQDDSIYLVNKAMADITVDAVAEAAWDRAFPRVLAKVASENATVFVNLANYPQTEAYGHATYRALWTENGVYMYITVKDEFVRYQNPVYQWENDGIEFFFTKAPGESFKQIIIPAMVGTTEPSHPAALEFESGSARGSHPDYNVFGYDANNWDETLFKWAIKKTAVGFDMEVYMDKDIVTNGNSETHFGLDKIFGGEINYDFAGQNQNSNGIYVREGIMAMLGNNNNGWAKSDYYGYFKLVDQETGLNTPSVAKFNAIFNANTKSIEIISNSAVSSVTVNNLAGQVMPTVYKDAKILVSSLKQGVYMVNAKDAVGNSLGIQKVVVY